MTEVLLIEDDSDLRENIHEFLTEEGFAIRSVANGQEGLQFLAQVPLPRVILLDLTMPVMDGRQFRAEQLRAAHLAEVPVILLSGDNDLKQKAEDLLVAGSLEKPFTLADLLDKVNQYCRG